MRMMCMVSCDVFLVEVPDGALAFYGNRWSSERFFLFSFVTLQVRVKKEKTRWTGKERDRRDQLKRGLMLALY